MEATPPLTFEKSVAPIKEITPTGGLLDSAGTGIGFTQRYDKLVIAVGAYAQSEFMTMATQACVKLTIDLYLTSIQHTRRQITRTFLERR
jgi:hypothetical protein